MKPIWTRMKQEEARNIVAKLEGQRDAIVFSRDTTEVSWRQLPFYSTYKLYRLVNYATMPTFSMNYLSDGTDFVSLNGTAPPIYQVNVKDPILLEEANVISYLDFFFSNVQGSEGDVFLIKDPRTMPFMQTLSTTQQQSVMTSFKPLRITFEKEQNVFLVSGTLYYGGGLLASTIQVTHDGRLSFQNQSLLLSGIHFPYSPSAQGWMEG